MLNLIINGIGYACPENWGEITIGKASQLQALTASQPEAVSKYLMSLAEGAGMTLTEAEAADYDTYRRNVLGLLADVPDEILEHTIEADVVDVFDGCLVLFAVSMAYTPIYEPKGMDSFLWIGETLHFPTSGEDVLGLSTPLEAISAREFCEASDVVAASDMRLAPLLVAILCRPQGEPYIEAQVKRRAKTMADLPMSIYLELFFCLLQLIATSERNIPNVMPKRTPKRVQIQK